ncbi:hypothetical protein NDU88_005659 [Pleurodeles waltl]|uniref:Uncharacterized protein n=1 Tax=Pleurodeles waltl TaxID=8319 RepID=A0AAV7LPQ8_PLEWA|nr:hypothetical protein NDU88_005659 [Pleurodeles waltl]
MGSVQWNEPSGECGMREGWQLWREVGAGGTGEGAVIRIYLKIKDLLYIDDSDLSVATRVPEDVIEAYNQLLLPYARSLRFLSQWIPPATLCRRRKYGRSSGTHLPILVIEGEGDGVEDKYETAIKSLDVRFVKCKNVTLERHKFYRRVQAEGESASNYVGALRLLAVSCDYKEFEEEMIRDQLVEKTNNKKVQEALLSTANLTLQKALEIATRIESTVSFMEQMSISEDKNPRPDVLAVKSFYKKGNKRNSNSLQATFSKTEKKFSNKSLECYRCGSTAHLGNAKFCPAVDKMCAIWGRGFGRQDGGRTLRVLWTPPSSALNHCGPKERKNAVHGAPVSRGPVEKFVGANRWKAGGSPSYGDPAAPVKRSSRWRPLRDAPGGSEVGLGAPTKLTAAG